MTKPKNDCFSRIKGSDAIGTLPNLEKMYGKKKAQQMINDALNAPNFYGRLNKEEIKSF